MTLSPVYEFVIYDPGHMHADKTTKKCYCPFKSSHHRGSLIWKYL